jgi:hypothetical protein
MASTKLAGIDDDQYRRDVLLLSSGEQESAREQQLVEDAKQLGLKVPDVEIVASLAASIASGMVDLSSPILSSSSSTDRNSVCDALSIQESAPLDQLGSSLSEYTLSSNPAKGGSTRSIASLSTRPTSYSSSEGKLAQGTDTITIGPFGHRGSLLSVINGSEKKEKERRRSSIKSAIGKIHFRKKRTPSTVLLPPAAQITFTKGESGVEKLYVESKPSTSRRSLAQDDEEEVLKLEVPVFDNEALLRSLANPELKQLREAHTMERNRHVSFQNNLVGELRRIQQTKVEETLAHNRHIEDEKREKVLPPSDLYFFHVLKHYLEYRRRLSHGRTAIGGRDGASTGIRKGQNELPNTNKIHGRIFEQLKPSKLAISIHFRVRLDDRSQFHTTAKGTAGTGISRLRCHGSTS